MLWTHAKHILLKNTGFLWSCKQDRVFPLQKIKWKEELGIESDHFVNHRGMPPLILLHKLTPRRNEGMPYVCAKGVHTPKHTWPSLFVRYTKNTSTPIIVQSCLTWTLQLSDIPSCLWAVCLNTFKSFLLMQGTIKLSNGHCHYVKDGLYCQQFEHCLLPGSAEEMSGARYFKAINLSAFLFRLITF